MNSFKTPKGTVLPILNLKGKDYLEVKFRLVWFREEKPDWRIETEMVRGDEKSSLFKAIIRNAEGNVMATSHKTENLAGFPDHAEKAETGAIGRALALIGYGTQFAPDLEEGERIVDAPVQRPTGQLRPSNDEIPDFHKPAPAPKALQMVQSSYEIPIGKFKGMLLTNVHPADLKEYAVYIRGQAKKNNEQIKGKMAELFAKIDAI